MTPISIALEWFKNPDHLPLIAGIENGWFREAGFDLSLVEPEGHYDGLAAAIRGEVTLACNEPLHMLDESRPGLKALGCFFETEGGILLKRDALEKLKAGHSLRVASPVSEFIPDRIAVEILQRWGKQQGIELDDTQIQIEAAGFEHLNNLQNGFDAAWLCFANFEGVEAREAGLDALFINTGSVDMANFSALELFTGEDYLAEHQHQLVKISEIISRGAQHCRENPDQARSLWYQHSGESPSSLMDAIVADTCPRFVAPVAPDRQRWYPLWQQFSELGLAKVDADGFEALYSPAKRAGKVYRVND